MMTTRFITRGKGSGRKVIPLKGGAQGHGLRPSISDARTFDDYIKELTDDEWWRYVFYKFDSMYFTDIMKNWDEDTQKAAVKDLARMFPKSGIEGDEYLMDVLDYLEYQDYEKFVRSWADVGDIAETMDDWDKINKAEGRKEVLQIIMDREIGYD